MFERSIAMKYNKVYLILNFQVLCTSMESEIASNNIQIML